MFTPLLYWLREESKHEISKKHECKTVKNSFTNETVFRDGACMPVKIANSNWPPMLDRARSALEFAHGPLQQRVYYKTFVSFYFLLSLSLFVRANSKSRSLIQVSHEFRFNIYIAIHFLSLCIYLCFFLVFSTLFYFRFSLLIIFSQT